MDKTLNGWHLERTASICRERCGGQGFLSVNKFGDFLSISHACLTAEGDNRVLMVKVCKDYLTNVNKKGHKLPQPSMGVEAMSQFEQVSDVTFLMDLLKYREVSLFKQLVATTKAQLKNGKSSYEVLMRETSDIMQDLARAYGEREAMQYTVERVAQLKNQENRELMTQVLQLYGLEIVERDLHHHVLAKLINKQTAMQVTLTKLALVKSLAQRANDLLDCMSIPKDCLYAPIAANYVKYNEGPNYGEVIGAKM